MKYRVFDIITNETISVEDSLVKAQQVEDYYNTTMQDVLASDTEFIFEYGDE